MAAFKADHDAIIAAYHADLTLALETQIRLIEDYEIKLKGPTAKAEDLTALMAQARDKRTEIAAKLAAISAKVKTADRNFEIALQIHAAIDSFLNRPTVSEEDVQGLFQTIMGLKDQLLPTK